MGTKIEWVKNADGMQGETWNPITGCTKISPGCRNCYAARMAQRLKGRYGYPADDGFRVTLHPDRLEQPLRWKKPRRIFVCSMSDWMHPDVPAAFVDDMLEVIAACPQHTFLTLTKRPENLEEKLYGVTAEHPCRELGGGDYLSNLWLGVTVENQEQDWRIGELLKIPAAVRFVSCEPLLGPITFRWAKWDNWKDASGNRRETVDHLDGLRMLDWVICGCESGPKRRPAQLDWFRSLRDQCQAAGVPYFLKQMEIGGKLVKMPELDGRVWAEFPEV